MSRWIEEPVYDENDGHQLVDDEVDHGIVVCSSSCSPESRSAKTIPVMAMYKRRGFASVE